MGNLFERKSYYLALTAEEYWDIDENLVFLGSWCLVHEKCAFWEALNGDVMPSPFAAYSVLQDAYDYVDSVYEKIPPALAKAMNVIHGLNCSLRYWRIVLGSWLHDYIGIAKKTIKAAKDVGANAIKLQTYTANTMTLNSQKKTL